MGVARLWDILDPVKSRQNLECLQGKTICVDVSIWICEAEFTPQLKDSCSKPYLRNLFFRVRCLQSVGAYPIFVLDGEPPKLKWGTIIKRRQNTPHRGGDRYCGWTSTSKSLQSAESNRRKNPVRR